MCVEGTDQASLLKDADWSIAQWETIVQERVLLNWLVNVPTPQEQARARRLTIEQIHKVCPYPYACLCVHVYLRAWRRVNHILALTRAHRPAH